MVNAKLDVDPQGQPILEMEFKFVRYRLVIDDISRAEEIIDILKLVVNHNKNAKPAKKEELPKFYKNYKS